MFVVQSNYFADIKNEKDVRVLDTKSLVELATRDDTLKKHLEKYQDGFAPVLFISNCGAEELEIQVSPLTLALSFLAENTERDEYDLAVSLIAESEWYVRQYPIEDDSLDLDSLVLLAHLVYATVRPKSQRVATPLHSLRVLTPFQVK